MFIALFRGENMPLEGERPFLIAGCIAIWKNMANLGGDKCDFWPFFGRVGFAPAESPGHLGEQLYQELDSDILSYVEDCKLLYLAEKVFIDCETIPVFGQILVIELPEVSDEDLAKSLKTLRRAIANLPFELEFHNGCH